MIIAKETLKLIEDCVARDQGNEFRKQLEIVMPHIGDAYRPSDGGGRSHLGASLIGSECARDLWYGFRWFLKPKFSGRILRLFNRGHMEEGRFIALLLAAGIQVFQQDANGNQFRISHFGGHFGGSGDGIALGIPDIPQGAYALLEFKTHSDKSFKSLQQDGVKRAKPEHYIQMQMYLDDMKLHYAVYFAVNKNDDTIHCEIVVKDEYTAPQMIDRAEMIIFSPKPLRKINEKASWYQCKYCDFSNICHGNAVPDMNCRTCSFSSPERNGTWVCRNTGEVLDKEMQQKGCEEYQRVA